MRSGRLLALALVVAAPLGAAAVDAPHEAGTNCSNCHLGHNAPGGALTSRLGTYSLCQSCHVSGAFGFPWALSYQATPGVSGSSHRWDAMASNLGATPPDSASTDPAAAAMASHLEAGKLKCTTCHDTHQADTFATGRGTQRVSSVVKTAAGTDGGGTVAVVTPVAASATAKGYLVEIVAAGSGTTATFRLSNDNGASWFQCTAATTYSYVAQPSGVACSAGASVALNDGTNVSVAFAGGTSTSFRVGDRFKLYVSYPYLRADNGDAKMCLACHQDRNQHWQDVEGGVANGVTGGNLTGVSLGTTVFHHPVGQALAKTYDNAAPVDADGNTQGLAGDTNRTNDLVLGTGGVVTCLTCHSPHNADSNSVSVDP